MIVRMLQTTRQGQIEAGTISYVDGEFKVEGNLNEQSILRTLFADGKLPDNPSEIEAALARMPQLYDGVYARAQIVGMEEGGPGSGWFAPPKGTHGKGSQGGPVSKRQAGLPGLKPGPGAWQKPEDEVATPQGQQRHGQWGVPIEEPKPEEEPEPEPSGPDIPTGPSHGGDMDLWTDWSDPGWSEQREEWFREAELWEEYGEKNGVDRAYDREWIATSACEEEGTPLYAMYDGHELVGLVSMQEYVESGDYFGGDPDTQYRYVEWLATKRGGYGRHLLNHARELAAEQGFGIYLTSIPESYGFYYAMGGQQSVGGKFYWEPLYGEAERPEGGYVDALAWSDKDGSGKKWKGRGKPYAEGGPGSGWFAPPKGTHGKGSQGGPVGRYETVFIKTVDAGQIKSETEQRAGITEPVHIEYTNGVEAQWKEHAAGGTFHDSFSELGAWELAQVLSPDETVVPQVEYHERDGKPGTIHRFVPGQPGGAMWYEDQKAAIADPQNLDRLEVMMALDVAIGNFDRHDGNWIIDEDGKLWAIDHGHATWQRHSGFGDLEMGRHPAWLLTYDHPSLSEYNRHGESYTTFSFREETLEDWRSIGIWEFERVLEAAIEDGENVEQDYGYPPTRVDVYEAWDNFQMLLDAGEVQYRGY